MTTEDLQKKIQEVKSTSSMLRVRETLMSFIPILKDKVGIEDVYTKTEVDTSFDSVDSEIQGLQSNKADVSDIPDVSNLATKTELTDGLASKIEDAPSDGKQYARQDKAWSEVVSGGSGSLVKVDLGDGAVAYKLDSNDLVPTTSSIDLRAGNQETAIGTYAVCISAELPEEAGNTASGDASTVSGGQGNTASGNYSAVSGGYENTASGRNSAVSGGVSNTAEGGSSTISGGESNKASGNCSTVSGGEGNTASENYTTVSGGHSNTASGEFSTVTGGYYNTATNYSETVVGMYSDNTGAVQTTRVAGSPIFRVGVGENGSDRREGFIVTNEGNLRLPEAGTGIELKSPNGTAYTLTVSDAGELVVTAV